MGANLTSSVGSPVETLDAALQRLDVLGAAIRTVSPFYSTPAFPAGNGPDYVNAAVKIHVTWTAGRTLEVLHQIEAEMERTRETRWGQRTLDLDLLAYADLVVPDIQTHEAWRAMPLEAQMAETPQELILPHPRIQDRGFVLVPLADVAPDWVHPILGKSVLEMRDALLPDALKDIRKLE